MQTVKKLVENLGYPRSMLDWKFDPNYMVRGLAIDKVLADATFVTRHIQQIAHNSVSHCELCRPEETC